MRYVLAPVVILVVSLILLSVTDSAVAGWIALISLLVVVAMTLVGWAIS